MTMDLADDQMCFGCGTRNLAGLKMSFEHPKRGLLRSSVIFRKEHQGFKDIVHGGMIGLVLDEVMVNLAWKDGLPAVTAELTVRLKQAAPVGQKILLEARLEREDPRVLILRADARTETGRVLAIATAKCVRVVGFSKSVESDSSQR